MNTVFPVSGFSLTSFPVIMTNFSDISNWTNDDRFSELRNFSLWLIEFQEHLNNITEHPIHSNEVSSTGAVEEKIRLILPYSIILLLAVVGNVLVIVTLAVNKRMRTVTNVFLLNLAISDLLLGVFCMPFTLIGVLMREFVFGDVMCRLIPYLQAVSVSVSAWTLVSISVERYYAICHPLKSRQWQTLSHAYRMIGGVWMGSMTCMLPIAILSELQPLRRVDRFKCRESWPTETAEKLFNIFLDVVLLVTPLLIMIITYSLITLTLWRAIRPFRSRTEGKRRLALRRVREVQYPLTTRCRNISSTLPNTSRSTSYSRAHQDRNMSSTVRRTNHGTSCTRAHQDTNGRELHTIQSVSNHERSLAQKKRVIKMLFVVVFEFFVCWTPIHVINTISLFNPIGVYGGLGYQGISFLQLLAYTSSCCNPITYCFMNAKFRQSFINIFGCKSERWHVQYPSSRSGTLGGTVGHAAFTEGNIQRPKYFQELSVTYPKEEATQQ
ncbi:cholecystokinin receptor-like [Limulus polyphemus]|uniref:Gastrin/cholecystokinin type B receptor n=1 Tax=Limulus polyphemus TaxID=6850 RepID=A0ABM1SJU8_LIMPO|nr:cholecystokinin receptor-like [Limulus polyphemus]XP_022243904.1 cholecystokinin receptor-like [Limulus polyphemus]